MGNEFFVMNNVDFMGTSVPLLEGGFREGEKCVLVSYLANLLNMETRALNQLITNNANDFVYGIDIIDLKKCAISNDVFLKYGLITKAQWSNASSVFALSEQGLVILTSKLKSPQAKTFLRNFIQSYFRMREQLEQQNIFLHLLGDIYQGGQQGVVASRKLVDMEKKPLLDKIQEQQPKVEFADCVTSSEGSILVRQLARMLCRSGLNIGQNRLFTWLRDNGYVVRQAGTDYNNPTQKSVKLGVMESKISVDKKTNREYVTAMITPKGQQYFTNKLREEFSNGKFK